MDEKKARIEINTSTGEFKIEGSEEFIERHMGKIDEFIERFHSRKMDVKDPHPSSGEEKSHPSGDSKPKGDSTEINVEQEFGEYKNQFPKKLNLKECALVAGYYLQKKSPDDNFEAKAVGSLWKSKGGRVVKGPTIYLGRSVKDGWVYPDDGNWKVGQNGIDKLIELKKKRETTKEA